jgi:hypothetical protein
MLEMTERRKPGQMSAERRNKNTFPDNRNLRKVEFLLSLVVSPGPVQSSFLVIQMQAD